MKTIASFVFLLSLIHHPILQARPNSVDCLEKKIVYEKKSYLADLFVSLANLVRVDGQPPITDPKRYMTHLDEMYSENGSCSQIKITLKKLDAHITKIEKATADYSKALGVSKADVQNILKEYDSDFVEKTKEAKGENEDNEG